MDTYDFANRAEYLGIGIWGNKRAKPGCRVDELGSALVNVLMGPRSTEMKHKATELARLCAANGGGRAMAARAILEEVARLRQARMSKQDGNDGEVGEHEGEEENQAA